MNEIDLVKEMAALRHDLEVLRAAVKRLIAVIQKIENRVLVLEADRDAEETSRMERLERGYE